MAIKGEAGEIICREVKRANSRTREA